MPTTPTAPLTITPYARRSRRDLLRLIDEQYRLHIHLDWNTVDEWIDDPAALIRMIWQGDRLLGAIAAAQPIEGASWLRLVALTDDADPDEVLRILWPSLRDVLLRLGTRHVGLLMLRPWLIPHAEKLGFACREEVVTLARVGGAIPAPLRSDLAIWHGDVNALDTAVAVDHSAFAPLWRLPRESIRLAIRSASSFTLAIHDAQVLGYLIAMRYQNGGHLARLATLPEAQGTGVGGALMTEMLNGFERRGIYYVTVNTQETNQQSQRLYRRYGFELTGLNMPVWTLSLI